MDDCDLEKLIIKPGKLSPVFHKNTTEYHCILGCDVEEVTFQCITSDTGASSVVLGAGGSKKVPLKEGETAEIKLEVTAEDGRTTKIYTVFAKRLSAKDASLQNLTVEEGDIEPDFSSSNLTYYCTVACNIVQVTPKPSVADPKIAVTVGGEKAGSSLPLNYGVTEICLEVTSIDGSCKQVYKIIVNKKQLPFFAEFQNASNTLKYECPFSLAPLHQPITISDTDPKHTFSAAILDEFVRTSKYDPLTDEPFGKEWRVEDHEVDKELSTQNVTIPLLNGEKSSALKISEVGTLLKTILQPPKFEEAGKKYESSCQLTHSPQVRSWEKSLQQIFDETDATKLIKKAEETLQKYYTSLPRPGRQTQYPEGESPLDYLHHASHCYATVLKSKNRDANLHLQLGLILEETYYAEDLYGLGKSKAGGEVAGTDQAAQESSKEEDCLAICKLRGVSERAPLSLQLKAIDEEYHHLLDSGQSAKADHVQALYAWKNKQATQEGRASQKAADEESTLGQAYLKYLDALSLDENKSNHHFNVGRVLVIRGEYEEAVSRLEATLTCNSKHTMAKFYLGLALALKKDGPGSRWKEAVMLLFEGFAAIQEKCITNSMETSVSPPPSTLHSVDLVRLSNVHLLRGLIQLGCLLNNNPTISSCMAPQYVFHNAAVLACMALTGLNRGDTYQQIEWVLLDAHSNLLQMLLKSKESNPALIAARCARLSALIRRTTIPQNADLHTLQLKTCRMLVETQPCSSQALCLLGNAQLAQYDCDPQADTAGAELESAKASFKLSIELEGKPSVGQPTEPLLSQKWWQDKVKEEEKNLPAKKKEDGTASAAKGGAAAKPAAGRGGATAGRGGAAPSRGGATAGRSGAAANRGGATAARGGATAARGGSTAGRGAAAGGARGGTTTARRASIPTKGQAKPADPHAKPPAAGAKQATTSKPGSASKRPESASKRPASASKRPSSASKRPSSAAKPADAPLNKKSYLPRLGLARALSRNTDDLTESKKYYEEVIVMSPEVHDAYIESAEMLRTKDPMGAVDIYCKFPVPENPGFDDAYIFGEIVLLLMKGEKFDDTRLAPNMIALGKIMGLQSLEKYVSILEDKFKTELLKTIYAGVNNKSVDDSDMQAFFKFKCWS